MFVKYEVLFKHARKIPDKEMARGEMPFQECILLVKVRENPVECAHEIIEKDFPSKGSNKKKLVFV